MKSAEEGGSIYGPGFDVSRIINGEERHFLIDTRGLMLHVVIYPADILDQDGGRFVLNTLFGCFHFLKKPFADGGYKDPVSAKAVVQVMPSVCVEIMKRSV